MSSVAGSAGCPSSSLFNIDIARATSAPRSVRARIAAKSIRWSSFLVIGRLASRKLAERNQRDGDGVVAEGG